MGAADPLQDLDPGSPRHRHIEDQQLEAAVASLGERPRPVLGLHDLVPLPAQEGGDHPPAQGHVLGQQDA